MTAGDTKGTVTLKVTGDTAPVGGVSCHLSLAAPARSAGRQTTTVRPADRSISADLIRIEIGKGCALYLTPTEYANGIARGKRIRRGKRVLAVEQERDAGGVRP